MQTFWQGFCSQLVMPSDPSLTVGLLIPAPLQSQPWENKYLWNIFILRWQISQTGEKYFLAILFNIVPDSLLELPGVSTNCPNLANQLHYAKALFVECPGSYNCIQYPGSTIGTISTIGSEDTISWYNQIKCPVVLCIPLWSFTLSFEVFEFWWSGDLALIEYRIHEIFLMSAFERCKIFTMAPFERWYGKKISEICIQ